MFYQDATLRNSHVIRHLFEIILQFHKIRPFPALDLGRLYPYLNLTLDINLRGTIQYGTHYREYVYTTEDVCPFLVVIDSWKITIIQ